MELFILTLVFFGAIIIHWVLMNYVMPPGYKKWLHQRWERKDNDQDDSRN